MADESGTPVTDTTQAGDVTPEAATALEAATAETEEATEAPETTEASETKPEETESKEEDGKAPEAYDFKVPEGMELDAAAVEKFSPLMKEAGLTQEQAQKFADVYTDIRKAESAATDKFYTDLKAEASKLPPEQLALAKKAVLHAGALGEKVMTDIYMGNNPALIPLLAYFGKLVSEGTFHEGGEGKGDAAKWKDGVPVFTYDSH